MKLAPRYQGYSIPATKFVKNQVAAPPELHARILKRVEECFLRFQGLVDTPIPTDAIPTDQMLVFFSGSTTAGYVHPKRFGNRVFLNLTLVQENEAEFMRETIPHAYQRPQSLAWYTLEKTDEAVRHQTSEVS